LERLEALVVPDTRVPEIMTIEFVDAVTREVVSSRVFELPPRRVGSKLPGRRR
jgi:hypothetical protein